MAFQMNDMTKPVKERLGFDPASVKKLSFGELIKKIDPGIILTGIVIGPGNITTSAMMGANYGYKMLWLLIPIILMGITFTLSSYRISIMTGLPILHAIRHYYGGIASGFCGVALFLSCFFFTLGNITGTGAGMNLIFGFDWRIGSLIMLAILAFCYLTKGVYSKVEKGIMICACGFCSNDPSGRGGPKCPVNIWAVQRSLIECSLCFLLFNGIEHLSECPLLKGLSGCFPRFPLL